MTHHIPQGGAKSSQRKGPVQVDETSKFVKNALVASMGAPLAMRHGLFAEGNTSVAREHNVFEGLTPAAAHALEEKNLVKTTAQVDSLIADGPFRPNWASLHGHQDPGWFHDAKFGIYTHWGPVTVGSSFYPGDQEWYGNQMYKPDQPAFQYEKEHFGDQSKVGYKDLIPKLTGENFNADEWADIFVKAGAKFAGPVAIHHDNFAMWNSSLTRWNSVNMGPHRDIVGALEKAYRKRGLRYVTTFHHGYAWRYYEPSFAYDGANPQYSDLYTQVHKPDAPPSKHFQDRWLAEVYEVLEKYKPDLIYFDFEFYEVITPEYQQKLFATAYDWAVRNHREIGVTQKSRAIHEHTGILDFERGREDRITPYPWLDDTAIGPWFYVASHHLKTPATIVGIFVDIVSKNGCMMLDIGPKVDGTLPEKSVQILLGVGSWLRINGEAIYGTRPWTVYGEGPTKNAGGAFSEQHEKPYTAEDIRFTTKNNALYAIILGQPGQETFITSLTPDKKLWFGSVRHIHMLGVEGALSWTQEQAGLRVQIPKTKPTSVAYVLKIT